MKRECFSKLAMTKKSFAFTLAEVLIVLAVLGVIAAITIPTLIQDAREKALITALKKNYTIFSQAVDMAVADNGSPDNWDIGVQFTGVGALKLYNILKPYLKIEKECGIAQSKGCFADHYEALFNANSAYQPDISSQYAKGVLLSGTSFYFWSGGTGCPLDWCAYVGVDVNGKSGPNKMGVDYFAFILTKDGVLEPFGRSKLISDYRESKCQYDNASQYNGFGCTNWAITHGNMDYLRKPGCFSYVCNQANK